MFAEAGQLRKIENDTITNKPYNFKASDRMEFIIEKDAMECEPQRDGSFSSSNALPPPPPSSSLNNTVNFPTNKSISQWNEDFFGRTVATTVHSSPFTSLRDEIVYLFGGIWTDIEDVNIETGEKLEYVYVWLETKQLNHCLKLRDEGKMKDAITNLFDHAE